MAKSNLDKLKDAIAESKALLEKSVIGEDDGQFPQQSADSLQEAITAAETLVSTDGAEPSQFDAQTTALNAAKQAFMETKIEKPEPVIRKVSLRGTPSQKKGAHTIHFKSTVVNFVDGEAQVPIELADELANAGYIE
ncbi:hypothetical protein [Paenibacillus sp. FSL K6-1230]|uniref:hypothetical protein n=1 Tax=Paenibacillus sp. FSL K6-1230 TaxID=2921603 RepID=UPI0030F7070C